MSRALTAFLAFLPAALIAACASTLPDNAPAWPPADYRKIIRDSGEIPNELKKEAQVSTAEDRCAATLRLGGMSQVGYEADSELFRGVLRRRKDTTGPAVSAD